ncbi:MAG: aminomethyl-transferring glycine dehydrogenase subunit GcvPA [Bacillota bacterium]|nr:aminomethyl-transferring glycine dehydrogenase subunit GcvPA [Bacillota bacterium]
MHKFIPNTKNDIKEMLEVIGASSIDDLFLDIPEKFRFNRELNIPDEMSEIELRKHIQEIASKNKSVDELTCFLGAGAYDHYKPSVVKTIMSRSEFYTAYTPYQPEISQGTLRVIFEYQTMMSELTGMFAANASLYDGQTAVVEAAIMAIQSKKKRGTILVSKSVHPESRKVLKTYLEHQNINIVEVELNDGVTDINNLKEKINKDVAGIIVQSPNFFGIVEDIEPIEKVTHENKSILIQSVDPMSLGILKNPGELGVDIAVGDAQCFGNPLNFGGPYLGFIATTKKLLRKIPGRIVGESVDKDGKRAFVLTLQAREQHIRRERATSNICSNQGLNVLIAAVYLSTLGKVGIKEVGIQCINKANYAMGKITESGKYSIKFNKPVFKEFAIEGNNEVSSINDKLLKENILGGYDLGKDYKEFDKVSLYAVTEKRTKKDIDTLSEILEVI